jgi:DNA gyrase/topoisomerase IV subunit B
LPTKLVDAWSKDRSECELFISEGDSAANGLISARDGKTQAVFPIRGKILSVRKAAIDKIYANQEIANIVQALGLEIDKKTQKLIYDENKLRYGKIIFACDADPDGQAIKNLLINCFHWLCPELLTKGHIYVAVPNVLSLVWNFSVYG